MEWTSLVSTAVGATVALVGTLFAYKVRSRDEFGREHRVERRQSYLDFLVALDGAHARLREVADSEDPQRRQAAAPPTA